MRILAIDTSCDDTSIAVVENFKVISNIVSSQIEVHQKWGGVYPTLAKREHQKNLVPVLVKALKKVESIKFEQLERLVKVADILNREKDLSKQLENFLKKHQKPKIDAMAVTNGPGLEPCLWVGINFAKALSYYWEIPLIPVNHIEAHIFASSVDKTIKVPFITLIVSGGHTQLILVKDLGKYKILGETRDDAAGECFDKIAKILGLGYPGGPAIAKIASQGKSQISNIRLPRPMINTKDYDFSFSGLKTAVWYDVRKQKRKTKKYVAEMCRESQQAIIDVLIKKTMKAARDYDIKTIVLGGGVSANKELRKQFKKKIKTIVPLAKYSTDNAVMIGLVASFKKPVAWQKVKAEANLRIA